MLDGTMKHQVVFGYCRSFGFQDGGSLFIATLSTNQRFLPLEYNEDATEGRCPQGLIFNRTSSCGMNRFHPKDRMATIVDLALSLLTAKLMGTPSSVDNQIRKLKRSGVKSLQLLAIGFLHDPS